MFTQIMAGIKRVLKKNSLVYYVYNLRNGFWKKGLKVIGGGQIRISGIRVRRKGKNNRLYIGNGVRLVNCTFNLCGNNNVIYIGDNCSLRGAHFYTENDNNEIHIGNNSTTTDKVDLCAIEGTKICIGNDCMISSDIYMSTGDGHSVCDMEGKRTNISKDIIVGNHVWIGTRVIICKGVRVGDNSIVAAGSVLASLCEEKSNVVIGGNPAKIVKYNSDWKRERI